MYGRDEYGYSELCTERRRADVTVEGVDFRISESDGGTWECIRIRSAEGERAIGRKRGIYDTLNTERFDLMDECEIGDATEEIARKLCEIFDTVGVLPEKLLILGLGNRALTPDSVGPRACDIIRPTMHIARMDPESFSEYECSEIAILCPGVLATSGLDTTDVVRGVSRRVAPDAIIAIDALCARDRERLGRTIQLSSAGIQPGGAVGRDGRGIDEDSIGVPVIAVGIPTVIDSSAFVDSHGATHRGEAMLVSPKEIDEIVSIGARIIGGAVNQAFGLSEY